MNNSLTMEPTAAEAEEFKIFLQQGLAEMDRLFLLMAEDQLLRTERGLPPPEAGDLGD